MEPKDFPSFFLKPKEEVFDSIDLEKKGFISKAQFLSFV